eukprot:Blabericola_migrator_1__10668@NODE_608_length_7306_cov_258_002348_g441_i0_p7_GENE_NODE_608_length_7306_cov_258_002348_g441_i0NODE_608_length_7306_cov_258_002348_g441_i0_p7_ORF_typecomplete_len142_score7_28_NODE_608_length_7306_cov_258_002348_g441_i011191544
MIQDVIQENIGVITVGEIGRNSTVATYATKLNGKCHVSKSSNLKNNLTLEPTQKTQNTPTMSDAVVMDHLPSQVADIQSIPGKKGTCPEVKEKIEDVADASHQSRRKQILGTAIKFTSSTVKRSRAFSVVRPPNRSRPVLL